MDRRAVFPDFRAEWVVYEDDDVIAVDKPAGIACMDDDGLPARLARFLAARDGLSEPAYVGIHQRLDRETSGVILYAKRREANAGLARSFGERTVDKRYVAGVTGWPEGGSTTLRDRLSKGKDGRVVPAGRGKLAVTHAREIERRGDRALLEVRIETGRTHQIRAQLAAAGAKIAGDALYGGEPAPRSMLHARRLALAHPRTRAPLALEARLPADFEAWLAGTPVFERESLRRALARALQRRWALARAPDTDTFRLVNGAGDGLPGIALDAYGDFLVLHLYDPELHTDALFDAVAALGFDGVYVKQRPRQANELGDTRTDELAPRDPVRGRAAPDELTVHENGMRFVVRLGDGLSTGLFLDQRDNRRRVRDMAESRAVLNLFAYTCPFTVAAALGGARRTVSVDVAAPALAWGERQVRALDTAGEHAFVREDAFAFLPRLARRGERFDLVIVDPPTYSTTKKTRWSSGRDWVGLATAALAVLAPEGHLLACSNDHRMSSQAFRRHLHEALRRAGHRAAQMKDLRLPPDFPTAAGEQAPKSVLVTFR